MRILLINYEYPPIGGGASNATYHIAKKLALLNNEVFVISSNFKDLKGISTEDGVLVHRIKCKREKKDSSNILEMLSFVFNAYLYIPKFLKKYKVDNTLVFFSIPCGIIGLLLKFYNIPYIISLRGSDVPEGDPQLNKLHSLIKPIRRFILKHSFSIVANSNGLKTLSEKHDPYPVSVIPNGVDIDFYHPSKIKADESFNIIFVGRFHSEKNIPFIFEVMKNLMNYERSDVYLHLVGDGPLREYLEKYEIKFSLKGRIIWHGWQDKHYISNLYREMSVLINPSLNEGMPNVVLEAMASGLPCLVSNVMGNNEVVVNAYNGYLFNLNNHQKCTDLIIELIENEKLYNELSSNARKYVEDNYSWQKTAAMYIKEFDNNRNTNKGQ